MTQRLDDADGDGAVAELVAGGSVVIPDLPLAATASDDHANGMSGATTLVMGKWKSGKINKLGDRDYFRYKPSATGKYKFEVSPQNGYWVGMTVISAAGARLQAATGTKLFSSTVTFSSTKYYVYLELVGPSLGAPTGSYTIRVSRG